MKTKLLRPYESLYSLGDLDVILEFSLEGSDLYNKTLNRISWLESIHHESELKNPKRIPLRKKIPSGAQYSLDNLKDILILLQKPRRSDLYNKTQHRISSIERALQKREAAKLKVPKQDERCYFSDLTEGQLMPSFCGVAKFRFVLCKVFLSYNNDDDAKASHPRTDKIPQLFGSIQAARFSLDPASPTFNIFNHKFNDPIAVAKLGCLSPHCIRYCSIPFSTSVKIAANLFVTTDKLVDMNTKSEYYSYFRRGTPEQFHDAFEVCNDSAVINFSDYFAKRPNGGSCSYTLKGRDGYLKLYYVALKYVVDAALEVVFVATSEETKVAGRVMAYYGKNFDYGCSPAEVDDYKAMLFETEQPEVKPGKINLMQSVLSVPAQFSLIIDANLSDSTSGDIILSGFYEFRVPADGGIMDGIIEGNDCSLKLKVDWKLPPFAEETTLAKGSYYSDLTKKQIFSERSVFDPATMDEEDGRWSLQKAISRLFGCYMTQNFCQTREVCASISTGTEADECDYLCTSVLNIWPEIRSHPYVYGPKHAGLDVKELINSFPEDAAMLERCVVGGPGFLKFKLSRTWIAESIFKMILNNLITWAPKLPIEKAIIDFLPRNIAKEMHMGHLQSTIIGETLARVLEYSGVRVRRRFYYGNYLDIKSKMMMTEFLIDRFPNGEVNDQAIGELEVLYEESKKRFAEDAEFRQRTQPVQDWDERHKFAWEQICMISRERYRKVYKRLGVHMKEEGERLHDYYISKTLDLLREKGYNTKRGGDEALVIEGRKLPLVDFAALWHALEIEKADEIVHVADEGQRDKIEKCITAAESVGWSVTNHCHDPLRHVGFVQVKGFEGFSLVQLLDEAKNHCRAVLVGKAGKELEHAAEALGCGAVKYEVLKNNRLTGYKFSFDDMLKETLFLQETHARIYLSVRRSTTTICNLVDEIYKVKDCLTLKDDSERKLGLHLLRFTEVLGEVSRVLAPHILCEYLFVLCDQFNKLYPDHSGQVLKPDEGSKILLFEATEVVIRTCFYFLGITPIVLSKKSLNIE